MDPVSGNTQEAVSDVATGIVENRKRIQARKSAKSTSKKNGDGDAVTILISPDHVRIVDRLNGEALNREYIKNISFTCCCDFPDKRKDRDAFAYVTTDERLV